VGRIDIYLSCPFFFSRRERRLSALAADEASVVPVVERNGKGFPIQRLGEARERWAAFSVSTL